MDLLQQNWLWISNNPWGFASLALFCIALSWGAASLFYRERIEILKERLAAPEKRAVPAAFTYTSSGRHGTNILANSTNDVFVEEWLSFRAEVPPKDRLHIELQGPKPKYLDDTGPSWMYGIGAINWTASGYDPHDGGRQSFEAEGGAADLKLQFLRAGEVQIIAREGTTQSPSWTRTLRVQAKSRGT